MASGNAHIGKPAPDFQATAVVDGAFKEVKLSDYRGEGGLEGPRWGGSLVSEGLGPHSSIPAPTSRQIRSRNKSCIALNLNGNTPSFL